MNVPMTSVPAIVERARAAFKRSAPPGRRPLALARELRLLHGIVSTYALSPELPRLRAAAGAAARTPAPERRIAPTRPRTLRPA